jgi:hypothetical protein
MPRLVAFAVLVALAAALSGCGGGAPVLSGARCLAQLDAEGVVYRTVELGAQQDQRCQVDTAVKISRAGAGLNHAVTMSCALASRFDEFERAAVQKAAMADLGRRVVRIDHLGAYSCRNSTGRRDQLSEHARGLAIDISGFRLSDGTSISVERDWAPPGPKGDFLRHLARAACGYFSVVLTPNSNREHFNHMHLDIGPGRLCSV